MHILPRTVFAGTFIYKPRAFWVKVILARRRLRGGGRVWWCYCVVMATVPLQLLPMYEQRVKLLVFPVRIDAWCKRSPHSPLALSLYTLLCAKSPPTHPRTHSRFFFWLAWNELFAWRRNTRCIFFVRARERNERANTRTQGLMNASARAFYFAVANVLLFVMPLRREAKRKKNHHRRICLHALWGSAQSAAPVLKWALGFILLPELILLQNAICSCSCKIFTLLSFQYKMLFIV